ncbi:nicotianamine synthase family protein [Tumebacillus sp. DT12]|uniref:Nicotianamine synthase family protein n=1 Tax=Tumebacillus lacus TaxID=2995335 RepID=A0ABT3X245_9BACL|nr:nicotianamine synthase family protein [Tumebacillus lacus]MCX7570984.1 nicotianamine synthase family protein [Tumebacillus lacus]
MKEKYQFLLSLKSLAFEINELNLYSKADSVCYELLQEKLDQLSRFMICEHNLQQWSLWEDHEEIRLHSGHLRETSVQALCDMEKYQSICTCNEELNISDYIGVLSGTVKQEVEEFGIDGSSKVLFIGSGAFPLSALTIAKETGAQVMCLDIDAEAVHLGKQIADASGLHANVTFSGNTAGEQAFLREATHIIVASLVPNKLEVLAELKTVVNDDVQIAVRYGNGLKSIFNYPLEQDLSVEWNLTRITREHSIYDTVVLTPKRHPVTERQVY